MSPKTETLRGKYIFITILKNGIVWSIPDDYELSDGIAQDKHAENNGKKAAPTSLKLNLAVWQFELKEVSTDIGQEENFAETEIVPSLGPCHTLIYINFNS